MKKNSYHYEKPRRSKAPLFLLAIVVLAGLSFGVALLWQGAEDSAKMGLESASIPSVPVTESSSTPEETEPLVESSASETSSQPIVSSEPEESEESSSSEGDASSSESGVEVSPVATSGTVEYTRREDFSYALQPSGKVVDISYFDDAIFFGDSLTSGFPLYMGSVLPNVKFIAIQGINTLNVNTKAAFPIGNEYYTFIDAAKQYGKKSKVYIMLGGNSLSLEKDQFVEGYRTFLKSVKELYPDAAIYLQSMMPVTINAHQVYPSVSNEIINEYNLAIMELAKEEKVYFVDVAVSVMDSEGRLPLEASPADGMHFGSVYYEKWLEYLRRHTVD